MEPFTPDPEATIVNVTEIMDEAMCEEVLKGFVQHMEWLPDDGKATVAAITIWCGEAMLNVA